MTHRPVDPDPLQGLLQTYVGERTPPGAAPHPATVVRAVRLRRRRRAVTGIVTGAVAVAVAGALLMQLDPTGRPSTPAAGSAASAAPSGSTRVDTSSVPTAAPPSGAVAFTGPGGCMGTYSAASVAESAGFAFAGTVAAIGRGDGSGTMPPGDVVPVRFEDAEWIVQGGKRSVVVALGRPVDSPAGDGLEVGMRLLVSGDTMPGEPGYMAWGCGFTRYYDPETARSWSDAARGNGS